MRFASIFTLATAFTGSLVAAAPATGSAANIMKRSDTGASIIDFEYVALAMRDLNERSASGQVSELQRRDDSDFIEQLLSQLHSSNLLTTFVSSLANSTRLKSAVQEGVTKLISEGSVDEALLLKAIKNSGKMLQFFESVLENEDLNTNLSADAYAILEEAESQGEAGRKRALAYSEPFIKRLYDDLADHNVMMKRDIDPDVLEAYGMDKRALLDAVGSIVESIFDSGVIGKIIKSIFGNSSFISSALALLEKVIQAVPWSNIFNSILNSGIIQKIFKWAFSFIVGLFQNGTIGNIIKTLFSGSGTSFLSRLLTVLVDVGQELFKSLSGSSSGLLGEIIGSIFGGLTSSGSSSTATKTGTSSSATGSSSSGSLSSWLSNLFGGSGSSSSSSSSGNTGSSSTSTGSTSSGSSSGGFFDSIFNDIFGSSSSSSSSSSTGSGSSSSSSSSSGNGNVFASSAQGCCCDAAKIKQRAIKRALHRKIKRSVKRALMNNAGVADDLFVNYAYAKV